MMGAMEQRELDCPGPIIPAREPPTVCHGVRLSHGDSLRYGIPGSPSVTVTCDGWTAGAGCELLEVKYCASDQPAAAVSKT